MSALARLDALRDDMTAWRHDLHANPETAFEEHRTADLIAGMLEAWGLDVRRGLGRTGVVGTLRAGADGRAIALRAELDALPIHEETGLPWASRAGGRMHACGHDGHAAMLLGAAKHLAAAPDFDGAVHFVFQPAEENEAGGRAMIEDGLFAQLAIDEVYGLHNWPGLDVGRFAVRAGPVTATLDLFDIRIAGRSGHAAMPHTGRDPIVCAAALVGALQSIVSRTVNPLHAAVVSVTQIHGGNAWNIIPGTVELKGTTRTFLPEVQDAVERRMDEMVRHVSAAHGCDGTLDYERRYPASVNSEAESRTAAAAAADVAGPDGVVHDADPTTGAEDFAFMLNERPGCYAFIGNGAASAPLHNPHYDFNDDALPYGAAYWVALVARRLGRR